MNGPYLLPLEPPLLTAKFDGLLALVLPSVLCVTCRPLKRCLKRRADPIYFVPLTSAILAVIADCRRSFKPSGLHALLTFDGYFE